MEAWTDSRLDDLAATLRPLPQETARIGAAVEALAVEMRSMREDMRSMREQQSAIQRQLAQIGWSLSGALAAAVFALVLALL